MSLTVHRLTKSFGGELALAGVDLEIKEGEIHALLGPNGSGKSTLIGCLSGRITPDEGTIVVGDRPFESFTPSTAFAAGTAVIYQHFSLIPSLSVRDNVFLGSEYTRYFRVDRVREMKQSRALLDELGTDLDTSRRVAGLSVGQRQLVEIAKAMRHQPRVLILDEPTAALSESEATALGAQLRELRNSGLAILYVTHLLGEVFEIADRVTVLRDGKTVLESPIDRVDRRDVISAIAPKGGVSALKRGDANVELRPTRFELKSFEAAGVGPVDLSVREGEVVALFGLLGSGRSEILEGVYGLRGQTGGSVTLDGESFVPRSATSALRRGIALVPADRASQSMFDTMSALDNLLLPNVTKLARGFLRDRRRERSLFAKSAQTLRLKPARAGAPARTFSGGNQQKLVVGRWLTDASNVRMLLLDEPTQGIDVGARADMYELIRGFAAKEGRAALFTSSDPEEVEALADRVLVLVRGRIVGELRQDQINPQKMLELAHGASGQSTRVQKPTARERADAK